MLPTAVITPITNLHLVPVPIILWPAPNKPELLCLRFGWPIDEDVLNGDGDVCT